MCGEGVKNSLFCCGSTGNVDDGASVGFITLACLSLLGKRKRRLGDSFSVALQRPLKFIDILPIASLNKKCGRVSRGTESTTASPACSRLGRIEQWRR